MVLIAHDGQLVALVLLGSAAVLVATVSQYFLAPLTADQLKVGVVDTPVAPLNGDERMGAGNREVAAACVAEQQSRHATKATSPRKSVLL